MSADCVLRPPQHPYQPQQTAAKVSSLAAVRRRKGDAKGAQDTESAVPVLACRGVGFVNFVEKEAALKAMQQLHGFRIREGHHMHITVQRSRAERHARARERQQLLQSVATTPPSSLHVPALQPLQPVYSLATLPGGTGNMDRLIISNPVTGVTYQIIQQ